MIIQMNYIKKQKDRQQIITSVIKEWENQKLQIIQSGINDPFETYYYPTHVQDATQVSKLQQKIKQKIVTSQNLCRIQEISQQLDSQLYVVNQSIKIQQIQNQTLDHMIACLEGQVKTAKIKHEVKAININQQSYKTSKSCQTDNQARKDACTMPQYNMNDEGVKKQSKRRYLYKMSVYSMDIRCQTNRQEQVQNNAKTLKQNNQRQNRAKIQPLVSQQIKYIKQQNLYTNTLKLQHNKQGYRLEMEKTMQSRDQVKQVYNDLQKQIKYLNHLKKNKQRTNKNKRKLYEQQKLKVKFMMELFWKCTHSSSPQTSNVLQESDVSLPLLQI